jgi:hypothetical protein
LSKKASPKKEGLQKELPLMGRLVFPFIGQGKDLGYERERRIEEREKQRRRQP